LANCKLKIPTITFRKNNILWLNIPMHNPCRVKPIQRK
jgi:hypothetical protein